MEIIRPDVLPEHAKPVFQGVRCTVWHWDQELFDGSQAIFEAVSYLGSAFVVPIVGDRILMQREEQPRRDVFVTVPGGLIDPADIDPLHAAKRELLEETGHSAAQWVHWLDLSSKGKIIWPRHVFIARDLKKMAEPNHDPGERIEQYTVSFDEFIALAEQPEFRMKELVPILLCALYKPGEKEKLREVFFGRQ